MPVPYLFSNVPGGTSIPLAELDANFSYLTSGTPQFLNLDVSGNLTVGGNSTVAGLLTVSDVLLTNGGSITVQGDTVVPAGFTGTGNLVLSAGPTLNDPIFTGPVLGTPLSGNLANCTGYPVTNLTGTGAGVITFLTNPSSASLLAAVTDETGSGSLVFSNGPNLSSPNLTTPVLGTPISGDLTNCTGFIASNLVGVVPISRGGTGLTTTGAVGDIITVTAPGVIGYAASPPASGLAGGNASQLVFQSAPNTTSFIANGTLGQVLLSNGASTPSWGSVNATSSITGVLPIANGGTGLSALGTGVQAALAAAVNTAGGFAMYPAGVPSGAVMMFAMSTPPTGWLIANGSAVSRTTYADLFTAIGTLYGVGDGSTTFNLPNLNGQFLRSWDTAGSVDPGRIFGSNQTAAFASHTHAATVTDPGHTHPVPIYNTGQGTLAGGAVIYPNPVPGVTTSAAVTGITVSNATTGGTETRPVNVALLACIKT